MLKVGRGVSDAYEARYKTKITFDNKMNFGRKISKQTLAFS